MKGLEQLGEHVKVALAKRGVWPVEMELVARADLGPDGNFAEVWVVVTKTNLYSIYGPAIAGANESKSHEARDNRLVQWSEIEFTEYELAKVQKCTIESMTGSGVLILAVDDVDIAICRFSMSMSSKFGKLARLIDKLREGKELEDKDLVDDHIETVCPKCGKPYPEQNRLVCPKCLDKRTLFFRVLSFVPRYKRQIVLILLCMFGSAGMAILSPYIGGVLLFDEALTPDGRYFGQAGYIVLMTVFCSIVSITLGIFHGRINAGMTAEVVYDLKVEVFTAMQRLSLRFFSSRQTGSLMTRIHWDAMHLQYFFHDGLPFFIVNALQIIGISAVLLWMNWKLALLVLVPMPFIVWFMKTSFPKLWVLFGRRYRKSSAMNALVNDALTGFRVVKAFGKEQTEVRRFHGKNAEVYGVGVQAGNFVTTLFPVIGLMMAVGDLVVYALGGRYMVTGDLTFGKGMAFMGYMGMLYGPLEFMTHIIDWWTDCMNSAQRIFEILDSVPEISDAPDAVHMPRISGDVELRNVTFAYEPNKPVLHDVTMTVRAGEMIGLVGHSGAGKSTITNLISRLYDVDQGSVVIDGIDVKKIAIGDLRKQIGMVLQDTYLFAGSIAENIAYAKPDAAPEEIMMAAKAANAHDFICKLSDGYDTVIGRHGQNLSGGERQRISIARAILHNPRILILDEATASVDTETERLIQQALERLVKGRTTFAIAHRLSTLKNADRLVVMEGGKVVESGTHEELHKAKGVYHKLIQKQKEALKIRGVEQ